MNLCDIKTIEVEGYHRKLQVEFRGPSWFSSYYEVRVKLTGEDWENQGKYRNAVRGDYFMCRAAFDGIDQEWFKKLWEREQRRNRI